MLYLSKGSRTTVIKCTLSILPTYFISHFLLPSSVVNRIEMLQWDFLWGRIGEEFKSHLVNWPKVCMMNPSTGLWVVMMVSV
jgi:hypothetical protein